MELTYLYYFKTIAETENISKAAATLHISQPALSKSLSRLEESLGVSLFERKRGRISLTDIGRDYYGHISRAFECIDDGKLAIDEYLRKANESVVIGSPVSELMGSLIMEYLDRQDNMRITQFIYEPDALRQRLLDGSLDFAITPIPLGHRDLEQVKLMDEEIFLVVSHSHRLAKERTVNLSELKDERFLVNEASFDLLGVTDNCALAGFVPKVTLCSNETGLVTTALMQNMGVSLVPANVVYSRMVRPRGDDMTTALRIVDVDVSRFISVAKRRDKQLSHNARTLYRFAIDYFTGLGETFEAYFNTVFPPAPQMERKSLYLKDALERGEPRKTQ